MRCFSSWIFFCLIVLGCDDNDPGITDCPTKFSSLEPGPSASVDAIPVRPKHPCDYITARKNGDTWTVPARTSYDVQNNSLYIYGSGNEESLGFEVLFTGTGTYEIAPEANNQYLNNHAYYYTTVGRDVITSFYVLAHNASVEIVEFDETERTIKGNFEFSFEELSSSSTLSFVQGTFSVHLPD